MSYIIKCNNEPFASKIASEYEARLLFKHYSRPRKSACYRFQLINSEGMCIMDETSNKAADVKKAKEDKAK